MRSKWRIVVTGATFFGYSSDTVTPDCIKADYATKKNAELAMLTFAMLRPEIIGHVYVERGSKILIHNCTFNGIPEIG